MAIVLFDGVCHLCNGVVRFVIARDPHVRFQFATLTSATAARVLGTASTASPLPDSIVLIDGGRIFTKSDATLRLVRHLTFPWPLLYGLIVLPRGLRDWVYDLVARHRYRWFGRQDACMVPSPAVRARFLE
jgi:predicted DCC family thiol-disulfide oxidoreductase YuxK